MAGNPGKWETVVNKKKNVTKSDVKKAQQKFLDGEKIPKIEQRDPIKLDTTLYAAGFENKRLSDTVEETEKYPSRLNYEKEDSSHPSPRNNVRKKEKKPQKQQSAFDMAAKIKKLDIKALETYLKENQSKFPGQQLICLKYATNWLHSELAGPNEKTNLAYLNKSSDYPLCEVADKLKSVLQKEINKCDKNTLSAYFVFLVASLTAEVQQFHCTVAYRLLIQLVYEINPNIFVETCDEVVHGKSKSAESYLAIIWTFSQVSKNLKHGLSVWWSCMFPVLDKKNHAQAAVHFFNKLMNEHQGKKLDIVITHDQLVDLLEVMVSEKSPLQHSSGLMDEMKIHQDFVVKLAVNENNARTVFTNLLPVLRQKEDVNTRYAVCDALLQSLYMSNASMQWWTENIIHHMRESSILLKHIYNKLDKVNENFVLSKKYKKSVLRDSASEMKAQLDKANEKGRFEKKAGFKECRKLCNSLLQTSVRSTTSQKSKTWKLIKWIVLLAFLVAAVDLYRSPSYNESRVGHYLKRYGVEDNLIVLVGYSKNYTDQASSFIGKHAPHYYSKVSMYVDPVLEKSSAYISQMFQYLYKVSAPLRAYLNEVLPPLFETVSNFVVQQYNTCSVFVGDLFGKYFPIIQENVLNSYSWCCETLPKVVSHMQELFFVLCEKIYAVYPPFFDTLHEYGVNLWNYLVKMTPIWYEVVKDNSIVFIQSTQKYVNEGQTWIQHQLGNFSPTASK